MRKGFCLVALLACLPLCGAWFWQRRAAAPGVRAWPAAIPAFASAPPAAAYTLANGTAFVCVETDATGAEALARVRAAYAEGGWRAAPVRATDTLIFLRGESVAAALVQPTPRGTRVTVLQRPRGL